MVDRTPRSHMPEALEQLQQAEAESRRLVADLEEQTRITEQAQARVTELELLFKQTSWDKFNLEQRVTRLEETGRVALQGIWLKSPPPPFGHSCAWCGNCLTRAIDEFKAALAEGESG